MFKLQIIKGVLIIVVVLAINITAYYALRILNDMDRISESFSETNHLDEYK